ncbi:4'-phosphopantetheinyl transferase superfamily protein [Oscillatoria sp. FACHB-1407]|uniref:4'-phosphopantetheinyl transferase family protein n=1 Tax=Oscillatoria sp. FACHB-1407 TaxID=2692847 RepID=UPI0016894773|nr:4'-phosphopantetheinyl transferase superfamily protein [Oscillatoria sp. FACHB-1407]MBD2462240.1 4'-phosphopantetheinyl transferase superfamily protein [Oscillatoria sp. FACHB-1407]
MATYPVWTAPPATLELTPNTVHVWRVNTRSLAPQWQQFIHTLSEDEQIRANKYVADVHRQHFIVNRGILRSLLARYLQCAPSTLQFIYETYGKPQLANFPSHSPFSKECPLYFNVSHSHGTALYAIAFDRIVGIDLEYIRPIEVEPLTQRFFTPNEYEALCALPPQERQDAFFKLWTHKEALVKATGSGLQALKQFDVAFLLKPSLQPNQGLPNWFLHTIEIDATYKGAIAVQGEAVTLDYWLYTDFGF